MKYKLISLSGLIHDYQGEAKEYIPMPTVGFYDTTDAEDAHRLDVAMREHRKFESQCVLVEDQERAKRFMYGAAGLGSFENDFPNWKPKDRTLYTVEAPEMVEVEQWASKKDSPFWYDCMGNDTIGFDKTKSYRTVMRFKEVDKPCGLDYYQIRNGQCKYGETGGHNGEIICDICKKPEAKESQEELWADAIQNNVYANHFRDVEIDLETLKKKFVITRKS